MKLAQFGFELPEKLIAQYPVENRDESRLLVYYKSTEKIEHRVFKDVKDYFNDGDVMVFNDTKVFPARLFGSKEKTNAQIEVFLLRELNRDIKLWDVLVEPARKIRMGNKLYFGANNELTAEVIDNTTSCGRTIRFLSDMQHEDFKKILLSLGEMPIPNHIIKRNVEKIDTERYQTIFAQNEGAVVAPTAGLHFSKILFKRLEIIGVKLEFITLHVGLGNFRNIDVEDLTKHKADSEQIFIIEQVATTVNKAKDENRNICAVGTTVLKALESSVNTHGYLKPYDGWISKFIFPPYDVILPKSLITNFHMPKSSIMIAVSGFTGFQELKNIYDIAIKEKYKFGTYGDAMLVMP